MIFDLVAYKKLLDLFYKKEKFTDATAKEPKVYSLFGVLVLLWAVTYSVFMLVSMIMFLMSTFKCSVKEGLGSVFFTQPYVLWKFGKMITAGCQL